MQSRVVDMYANNHIENNISEPMIVDSLAKTLEMLVKCHDVSSQKITAIFIVVIIKCSFIFLSGLLQQVSWLFPFCI